MQIECFFYLKIHPGIMRGHPQESLCAFGTDAGRVNVAVSTAELLAVTVSITTGHGG